MNDLVGRTLCERYHVQTLIGRGGMAEVYKVWDAKRAVHLAMKVLREDLAEDKIFLRRFSREANTLAQLQHPHIVRFYGLEQDENLAFILMDFIDGTTLRREIFKSESNMPFNRILGIMRPLCSALHYAHEMGRVHCDLKPGNVMINQSGVVLVTDFGVARMMDAATATMVGAGTPAYMAPEQVRGLDPTPRTDIYALGVVLFEMLTGGERPFTGLRATIPGTTGDKVRWEHVHANPPSPRKWNPEISPVLDSIVMRCLEKEPRIRYTNALALLNALESSLFPAEEPASYKQVNEPIKTSAFEHDFQFKEDVEPGPMLFIKPEREIGDAQEEKEQNETSKIYKQQNYLRNLHRQIRLQIYLPIILFIPCLVGLIDYLFVEGVGTFSGWADAAFVLIGTVLMILGSILFVILVILILKVRQNYNEFLDQIEIIQPTLSGNDVESRN